MRILLFISIIGLTLTSNTLKAQLAASTRVVLVNQYLKKANDAFEKRDYSSALDYYLTVLKDEPNRVGIYWHTAEAAHNTRRYNVAGTYYEQLALTDSAKNYTYLNRQRAYIKKVTGDYDKAIELFKSYAAANTQLVAKGGSAMGNIDDEIAACEWAKTIVAAPPTSVVAPVTDKVNGLLTEIAPLWYNDNLYYTTAYTIAGSTRPVTHVFSSNLKDDSKMTALNVNSDTVHTAGYAPNTEGSRVYYNICKQLPTGEFRCEIYYKDILPDGRFKDSVRLSNNINLAGFTAAQPNIGKTAEGDVLFFSSDRPGGKGGLDIWMSKLDANGDAAAPTNIAPINTAKDDITPFYFDSGDMLFFSSTGHKSLGGFDIFYAKKSSTGDFENVNHTGFPLSGSYDDTYFTFNSAVGRSYFVSNRKGAECKEGEKDCVCNDIYVYEAKVDLKAETFLTGTKTPLTGVKLDLIDAETGEILFTTTNTEGNKFDFPLKLNKKYRLVASKPFHVSDTINFDTKGLWQTTTIFKELNLRPYPKLTVYVMDAVDGTPINDAKMEIWEEAKGGNKRLVSEILRGTNTYVYDKLEFGKTYIINGEKIAYDPDTNRLVIDGYGLSERYTYTDTLFLTPFRGLPLTLYFDNDHPNPSTTDTVSYLTYGETFYTYNLKEPEYLSAFYNRMVANKGKRGKTPKKIETADIDPLSLNDANNVSKFFNDSIRYGFNRLNEFSNLLIKYLNANQNLEIVVEGYASPLANPDYNRNLTARRISSLINHFYEYNNGILRPYILGGALRIRVEPYGESRALTGVSDDARDRRKSVYSVEAMRERKVKILEINRLPNNDKSISYNLKSTLKGYWSFEDKLSFLANRGEIEGKLGSSLGTSMGPNPNAPIPVEYGVTGRTARSVDAKKMGKKVSREVVMVDAYTGNVIETSGLVEVIDPRTNAVINRGKKKGEGYRYEVKLGENHEIKSYAFGYNTVTQNAFPLIYEANTEGVVKDTLFFTPFSGLPLPLYFDNDRPDPNSRKYRTVQSYEKAYKEYVNQKNQFVSMFNGLLAKQGSVPSAVNEMVSFFENDIKSNYEILNGYTHILKTYLEQGYNMEVTIEGYASPLSDPSYNEFLTNRRINSVVNFFNQTSNGNLAKYVKNGQLLLKVRPLGEARAAQGVSDDGQDTRSIYSLEASRERRVVIKDIQVTKIPKN